MQEEGIPPQVQEAKASSPPYDAPLALLGRGYSRSYASCELEFAPWLVPAQPEPGVDIG